MEYLVVHSLMNATTYDLTWESSGLVIPQMGILFYQMSLYFSHFTLDAHLIFNLLLVSHVNSHATEFDLR